MKRFYFISIAFAILSLSGIFLKAWTPARSQKTYASPPTTILICGLKDRPCVTYAISFHQPTARYGELQGEGVTDYSRKTISIAQSSDRFKNVEALQHEAFHAILWERGFDDDSEKWDIHAWIYFSEGAFPVFFHDNPEFVKYVMEGY
ncbi:MAG: hypothetical protein WA639_10900 [Candidatus Acidiferrum sp.]